MQKTYCIIKTITINDNRISCSKNNNIYAKNGMKL